MTLLEVIRPSATAERPTSDDGGRAGAAARILGTIGTASSGSVSTVCG
jgi:hypothetical protein